MTRCEELCDAATDCEPCALDRELDRIAVVEGIDQDGKPFVTVNGVRVHETADGEG